MATGEPLPACFDRHHAQPTTQTIWTSCPCRFELAGVGHNNMGLTVVDGGSPRGTAWSKERFHRSVHLLGVELLSRPIRHEVFHSAFHGAVVLDHELFVSIAVAKAHLFEVVEHRVPV